MAWVAPDGFYFLFVTGACRTEQHAGSVRCVCFGSQSQNTPCSFLLCAPAEDKLRAPVIIPPRRNYDEIHTSGHLWTHCWLRGNHNSASVEVSEIVAWKHVVRSYVSMLRRGSDFGPAGFSVSENRLFIFHRRPFRPQRTKRVFSYFSRHCHGWLDNQNAIQTAQMRNGFLPERARTWKGYAHVRQSCLRREKNISRYNTCQHFRLTALVCALWKNAVVKKSGRLRLYKCVRCACIDASKRNSCSGMKIWSLLGLEGLLFYLTESEVHIRCCQSSRTHTHTHSRVHRRFITSVVRETFSFIALLQPRLRIAQFYWWRNQCSELVRERLLMLHSGWLRAPFFPFHAWILRNGGRFMGWVAFSVHPNLIV